METTHVQDHIVLVNLNSVLTQTTLSRASIYRLARLGHFPRPIKLGVGRNGASAWIQAEVDAWLQSKIAVRDGSVGGAV